MLLARVIAKVVSSRQDVKLVGLQLKVVEVVDHALEPRGECYVAADPLGTAVGQLVFTSSGACARKAIGLEGTPVDLAVVGVIDEINGTVPEQQI